MEQTEATKKDNLTLSKDQETALARVQHWYKSWKDGETKQQVFFLAGWAGTGKTTVANLFSESLDKKDRVLYGSFTGKATLRMRQAGMGNARTLHSMIYKLEGVEKKKPVFKLDHKSVLKNASLLVLDECSMVDKNLGEDVLSFGVPVLILGDKGQLPPVRGTGYFTSRKPDATLNEVHRQALDNPIIQLATDIRRGHPIRKINEDKLVTFPQKIKTMEYIMGVDQILCGRNNVRRNINDIVRSTLGHTTTYPNKGEKIICLRNNNKEGIFNGMMGSMQEDANYQHGIVNLHFIDDEGNDHKIEAHPEGFENDELFKEMDYRLKNQLNEVTHGYAITVHKSQGSEWESVCLVDDGMFGWDRDTRKKWLYTAVTRAEDRLVILKAPQEFK